MIKFIYVAVLVLIFTACSSTNEQKEIYLYGTPAYNAQLKNAKVSLQSAKNIVCQTVLNDTKLRDIFFRNTKEVGYYFIYKDNYLFATSYLITNHDGSTTITSWIEVDIYTGELKKYRYPQNKMLYVNQLKNIIESFNCKKSEK